MCSPTSSRFIEDLELLSGQSLAAENIKGGMPIIKAHISARMQIILEGTVCMFTGWTSKMAELSTEVPQKKRKFEAQSVDQESSRGQIPVSRRSSTELLLQMPPNTNTCLPVWEYMSAAQVDVQWNVTPYRITIQITPLNTTEKVLSNDQPVPQPSSQSGPQHSTPLAHASLPDPSSSFMTSPCGASYPNRAFSPFAFSPGDCITSTSADEYEVTDLLFQPAPKAKWLQQACFHTLPSDEICICDQFLLGQCQNGFDCRLHHTPYPFHWQLRRRDTYQWVSTSHSAQVKLEKLYCDIKRDSVRLQEMWVQEGSMGFWVSKQVAN